MAVKKSTNKVKKYIVTVKNNPNFCGIGAGGIQFANGKAENVPGRMAAWFREHTGYEVKEMDENEGSKNTDSKNAEE